MTFEASDITYCSNVHRGESVAQIEQNFSQFIQPVCQQRGLKKMAAGLWISAMAAEQLQQPKQLSHFKLALEKADLCLTSLNGFPFGNFHQAQVKESVYLPDWSDIRRLQYTQHLAELLAACLGPNNQSGAISTLPLGYKRDWHRAKQQAALEHLGQLTTFLHQLEQRTGKRILICFEMEPDCVLESTNELIAFFTNQLKPHVAYPHYLAVCYDVCHQAVMFESAFNALQAIVAADILIGKIQLSSALHALDCLENDQLVELLHEFCEPKYLHQVKCKNAKGEVLNSADLPAALQDNSLNGDWRIHFHVPVNASHLLHPQLKTTRDELIQVFDFLQQHPQIRPCLEVETYSWQVLPASVRPKDDAGLIAGIVDELRWVENNLQQRELLTR